MQLQLSTSELMDIDKHYQRKEHVLFSFLEKHGITGPSKVMWAKDDNIRTALKRMNQAARDCPATAAETKKLSGACVLRALAAVEEMIFKEENILPPMSLETLTENEWAEIWASLPKYGWCLVEPQDGYTPPKRSAAATPTVPGDGAITMPTAYVTVEQLTAVLPTLPLDLTFVDAEDRVAFFSEGPQRIFARSKAIHAARGVTVLNLAPVDIVDRILGDFRAGHQNVAEFWIDSHGQFVHIRYFAVRDKEGAYLGTVELTQDVAPLQVLTGEGRLLQYN